MTVTINGTTGIANDGGYTGDGVVFADTTPANTLVTTTGGNVGIGTSSPSVPFQLRTNSATAAGIMAQINPNTSTNSASLNFNNGGSGSVYIGRASSAGTGPSSATISAYDTFFWNDGAQNIVFGTNNSERARIDSSGNLLVGTTGVSYGEKFAVVASGASSNNAYFLYNSTDDRSSVIVRHIRATGSTGATMLDFLSASGSSVGTIRSNGTVTAYNTSSDYRLKYDIAPMTGALAKVAALKPCTYKWNADGSDGEGFIAHELAEVVPGCVSGEKDAVNEDGSIKPQGIDTSFLVATLTAAIQELKAIVDAQGAEIAALKGTA